MNTTYMVGDVFEQMALIPDGTVDLVLTSPPFLALRSYLPDGHADKASEIGSEPDPATFIDTLLALTVEWDRILAPHGSICIELGDTYSGSGGAGGDYQTDGLRDGQNLFNGSGRRTGTWPQAKSLTLVPELYRIALAYGHNPITGRPSPAGRWRIRNVIRWCRPNPPVGALGDKFRPATSELVVACRSASRYFDLDAVRNRGTSFDRQNETKGKLRAAVECPEDGSGWMDGKPLVHNPAGAPPLDWWNIPTAPYTGAHYAAWPPALLARPILAMSPERVCTTCGEPSRRIVDISYQSNSGGTTGKRRNLAEPDGRTNGTGITGKPTMDRHSETVGWSDCGHDTWRRGHVLDPFAGTGTTLMVAEGHGRDSTGIDLDERNLHLARKRCGMFLTERSTP